MFREKAPLGATSTIVAKAGKPVLVVGTPGGRRIINTVLQVILNIVDHGMNVGQAVEAGRMHHQWLPDVATFEPWALSPDTRKVYEAMGHTLRVRDHTWGSVMAIAVNYETGLLAGAADSRAPDAGAEGH